MNCPNCSYEMGYEAMCPYCGVDPILFTKTTNISDLLYNKGLSQAKANDLSGAIESLTKSIDFNKNNTIARNLLGLIYFAVGRIGDALKQWVISGSLLRENNLALNYMQILQKESRQLEILNDSVKMYNMALDYLRQKSDDMAIIQLKKAIEINPEFVDALNLLTLCYLIQKDKQKAQELTEKVLSLDINNPIAIRYYKELFPSKVRPVPIRSVKNTPIDGKKFTSLLPKDSGSFGHTFPLYEIISFVVGVLCSLAIFYILVLPGAIEKKDADITNLNARLQTAETEYKDEKDRLDKRLLALQTENEKLIQENVEYTRATTLQDKLQKIENAQQLVNEEKFEEAADILFALDLTNLPASSVSVAQELRLQAYPAASQKLHQDAVNKYNLNEYEDAKTIFEKAEKYASDNASYKDSIIFHLGMIAKNEGDNETAKANFDKINNDFPNSQFKARATNQLSTLEQ